MLKASLSVLCVPVLIMTACVRSSTIPVRWRTEHATLDDIRNSLSLPVRMPPGHALALRKDLEPEDTLTVKTGLEWLKARANGYGAMTTYDITMQSWFDHTAGTSAHILQATPARDSYVREFSFGANSLSELPCTIHVDWDRITETNTIPRPCFLELFPRTSVSNASPYEIEIMEGGPTDGTMICLSVAAWGDFNSDGIEDLLMNYAYHNLGGSGRCYGHVLLSRLSRDAPLVELDLPPIDVQKLLNLLQSMDAQ